LISFIDRAVPEEEFCTRVRKFSLKQRHLFRCSPSLTRTHIDRSIEIELTFMRARAAATTILSQYQLDSTYSYSRTHDTYTHHHHGYERIHRSYV